jgi:hypothetical protein
VSAIWKQKRRKRRTIRKGIKKMREKESVRKEEIARALVFNLLLPSSSSFNVIAVR